MEVVSLVVTLITLMLVVRLANSLADMERRQGKHIQAGFDALHAAIKRIEGSRVSGTREAHSEGVASPSVVERAVRPPTFAAPPIPVPPAARPGVPPILDGSPLSEAPVRTPPPVPAFAPRPEVEVRAPVRPTHVEPPPPPGPGHKAKDFELDFGRRWTVFIGGGAVALGMILLARHSIAQGYLSPATRLALGGIFAIALMCAAEALRVMRVFVRTPSRNEAIPDIPATLFGAGAAGLFAALYAAYGVYGFIGEGLTFSLMALVAVVGMAVSLNYGPPLAVLGYLGSQAVPLLVGGIDGTGVGVYLAMTGASAFVIGHLRRWDWLRISVSVMLAVWVLALKGAAVHSAPVVAVTATLLAVWISAFRLRPGKAVSRDRRPDVATTATLGLAALSGAALTISTIGYASSVPTGPLVATMATGFAVMLVVLAVGVLAPAARYAAPLAAFGLALAVANLAGLAAPGLFPRWSDVGERPMDGFLLVRFHVAVFLATSLLAPFAIRRMSGISLGTAVIGTASVAGLTVAADLLVHAARWKGDWLVASSALAQAAVLLLAARPPARDGIGFRRLLLGEIPEARRAPSLIAATIGLTLLGLAATFVLTGASLTFVLSLVVLSAVVVGIAWKAPEMVAVAGVASVGIALQVVRDTFLRVLERGSGVGSDIITIAGQTILPGLVVVAAVLLTRRHVSGADLAEAERRLRGHADPAEGTAGAVSVVVMGSAAGALLLSGLVASVRWVVFGSAFAPPQSPADTGLACALLLSAGLTCMRLHRATGFAWLVDAVKYLAFGAALSMGAAVAFNPFSATGWVGALPVLNLLLVAYLVPAAIALLFAREVGNEAPGPLIAEKVPEMAGGIAVAGLFGFVTFSVTQAFQGAYLRFTRIGEGELWAYTLAWLVFAIGLLLYGLGRSSKPVRVTAFAFMIGVTLKAFLVDLSHLAGAARAMSFIALGLVLLGIGMFYQKVMRDGRETG